MSDKVYTVYKIFSDEGSFLWAGTPDGLGYSDDDGSTWSIYRYWNSTSQTDNEIELSAYPNPFYIDEHIFRQ